MVPKKTWIILLVVAVAVSSIPVFAQSQLGLINYSLDHLVGIQTVEQFQQGNRLYLLDLEDGISKTLGTFTVNGAPSKTSPSKVSFSENLVLNCTVDEKFES